MKNNYMNLLSKLTVNRHYLILDESDVIETLKIINAHKVFYANQKLKVGINKKSLNDKEWFIHFNSTDDKWMHVVADLNKNFDIIVKNGGNVKDLYLVKKRRL